jgi:hypothetical protein
VGTYHVDRDSGPSVRLTAELDTAVRDAEVVFLTGPIHKLRTYAMVLADHLSHGQIIVINNGRTFGALETRWMLSVGGCSADVTLVEAPPARWIDPHGATLNLTRTLDLPGAALPAHRASALGDPLNGPLSYISPLFSSALRSSFWDISGIVDIPALCLGGAAVRAGGPKIPMGGVPLPENDSFAHLIGEHQGNVIKDLISERRGVAASFGVRDLPETGDWVSLYVGGAKGDTARPVPGIDQAHALIRDGVIGSLVPLTSAARIAGIATPLHDAMIALASSVLGADLATAGRKLHSMGFEGDLNETRRALELAMEAL